MTQSASELSHIGEDKGKMRLPKWVCVTCGQPSNRRWNIERHIDICHDGIGHFVPFIEYSAYTQRGFYPQVSKHAFHYHSGKKRINYLETIQEEVWREYGRQLVNSAFHPRPMIRTGQNLINDSIWAMPRCKDVKENGISMSTNTQTSSVNSQDVFGYKGQTCKNCLQTSVKLLYFEEESKKNKDTQQVLDHKCEGKILDGVNEYVQDLKNMNFRESQNKLLQLLIRESIKIDWSGKAIYILAAKLSEPISEKLTFQCPTNPNKTLTIRCALQNQIQLDLVSASKTHWASRAMRQPRYTK